MPNELKTPAKTAAKTTPPRTPSRAPTLRKRPHLIWSPARRAAQSARARASAPWRHATGPRTKAGKSASSQNALRHGHRTARNIAARARIHSILRRQARFVRAVLALHAALARQKTATRPLFKRLILAKVTAHTERINPNPKRSALNVPYTRSDPHYRSCPDVCPL